MSAPPAVPKPVTVPEFVAAKAAGRRLAVLTAYDYTTARLFDQASVDALLVGDSLGMVVQGHSHSLRVTLDEVCEHLTALCTAVDLPVNADFEGGFAHKPEKVAANVARAVKTGVAGLSIEDSTGDVENPLYERAFAIERIKAARSAIDADNSGVLLVGRCEGFLVGQTDLNMVIDRLNAYSEAGADCLYAPGIKTREQISAVVKAVHPKPVNLLIGASGLSVAEAADLGVRRISVGGSLARTAWGGFMRAAREIAEKGSFTELGNGYPGGELNKMFS